VQCLLGLKELTANVGADTNIIIHHIMVIGVKAPAEMNTLFTPIEMEDGPTVVRKELLRSIQESP
jgi:hypothetical protein